jgi:hypothetical protein
MVLPLKFSLADARNSWSIITDSKFYLCELPWWTEITLKAKYFLWFQIISLGKFTDLILAWWEGFFSKCSNGRRKREK